MLRNFLPILIIFCFPLFGQVRINNLQPDGVQTNEPSISIHPKQPQIQLLGANVNLVYLSKDAGYTWAPLYLKPKEGFYGDPVVSIQPDGTFYICHLSKNPEKKWPAQFDRIVFEKSTNMGLSFSSVGIGFNGEKMQDKPWFCVDEGKKSPYQQRIYVAWTEFDSYGSSNPKDSSRIRFAYSQNLGDSFSTAVTVSDQSGDAMDGDGTLEGATLATGKKGEIYLVWAGAGKIWMDISKDGGKTWGKDRVLASQKGSWNTEDVNGLMRSNSMPFVKTDAQGHVYIIYGDNSLGDQDVFMLYSKDGGNTFSKPIRINNDAPGNGKDQFMPAIAFDQKKNTMYACWYDRRNSEFNRFLDVYCAPIKKGKVGKNMRLSERSFCVPDKTIFFGDYMGISAAKGNIAIAYGCYDHDKEIVTVNIASFTNKTLKKSDSRTLNPFLQAVQMQDTALVYIHFYLPLYRSCTLKLIRGEQLFYSQLFNPLVSSDNEVQIPTSKLPSGVYKIELSFKGKKIEQDFFIDISK
jgi:hypothetical protein